MLLLGEDIGTRINVWIQSATSKQSVIWIGTEIYPTYLDLILTEPKDTGMSLDAEKRETDIAQ